jgi:hypothetical protein
MAVGHKAYGAPLPRWRELVARATRHWLFTKYKIEKAVNFDLWSFLLMFISSYITRYGI